MHQISHERRIERIALMLERARRAATSEEAETYSERAAELMLKYQIDAATVRAAGERGTDKDEPIVKFDLVFTGIYGQVYLLFAHRIITELGGVQTVDASSLSKSKEHVLWLIGYRSDVECAHMMVSSLTVQCATALATWTHGRNFAGLTAMQKFKNRRSFIDSFALGASLRIRRARGTVESEAEPGTALALRSRDDEVSAFLVRLGLNLRERSVTHASGDWESLHAGTRAGLNANTHDTAVGATRRQLDRSDTL